MLSAAGLLLAIVCIAIVSIAVALAVVSWDEQIHTWGPRLLRCAALTVGAVVLLLAIFPTIAQVLP